MLFIPAEKKNFLISLLNKYDMHILFFFLRFCSEQNFGFFQTSSFMGLLDKLMNNCTSEMTLEDNVSEFVSYLRKMNSLKQGTSSVIEGFNTKQAKKIIDFLHQG